MYYGNLSFLNNYCERLRMLAISSEKQCREEFLGPWVQRKNYFCSERRKQLNFHGAGCAYVLYAG
jgi:hypothetical protein